MKKSKGFSLVELLVVISIIAILSLIGLSLFSNAQQRSRDAKRKADLKAIQNAMEINYSEVRGCYDTPVDSWFEANDVPNDEYRGTEYTASYTTLCDYDGDGTADDGYRSYSFSSVLEDDATTFEVVSRR
jgi:prepilin-type N-terminal cleavage/methylation domain-containing protein